MPRREQDFHGAVAQFKAGVSANRDVWVCELRTVEECTRFPQFPARGAHNAGVVLRDFFLELRFRPRNLRMAPYIDSLLAKKTVPADVIEMPLRVDRAQLISRPHSRRVAVDGLGA